MRKDCVMSSLCIKTNNDEILKYLQNEFKDFNIFKVNVLFLKNRWLMPKWNSRCITMPNFIP